MPIKPGPFVRKTQLSGAFTKLLFGSFVGIIGGYYIWAPYFAKKRLVQLEKLDKEE